MDRREYLTGVSVATATVIAGCLGGSEQFNNFENGLKDNNVDIENVANEERRWVLEYVPRGEGQERINELGEILRIYSDTVPTQEENEDHRRLDIIPLEADGSRSGSLEVDADSARAFRNDEISEEEYIFDVISGSIS
ncbi:hypothetical protein [Haloarcula salinisoli]|uniref:DUF8159 domain-containing protein n=1 Tax=Haloarcula salinisoli TaxID=2487746 RepID=A0A8J7YC19_9EURY|nr:hypothetical protein [Halomicroarcula salinisoli]MBX0303300.1 hypothetical protein [Halomicroarcula salinisoli]